MGTESLAMWGYVEGDPRLVGGVVTLVAAAAVVWVIHRVVRARRSR